MSFRQKNKNQYGYNMLELILILGFISVSSIGIYFSYFKVVDMYLVYKETQEIKRIVNDVSPIVSTGTKVNLSPKVLSDLGFIDFNRLTNNNANDVHYINQFSTESDFTSIYSDNDNKISYLKMVYLHMNSKFCSKIINNLEQNADFISIAHYVVKNKMNVDNYVEFNRENAISSCSKATALEDDFPVIMTFKL